MKYLIIVSVILFSCLLVILVSAEAPMFAFSVDSQNRPIIGCLEIDSHALSAIIKNFFLLQFIFSSRNFLT